MFSKKPINEYVEYTNLNPKMELKNLKNLVRVAKERKYRSIVIPYFFCGTAKTLVKGSDIKVVTVFGFPFDMYTQTILTTHKDDYDELDIVIPINLYYYNYPPKMNGIKAFFMQIKKLIPDKKLKLIIETAMMRDKPKQIKELCIASRDYIDVIKTNTGLIKRKSINDLYEDVKLIKKHWKKEVKAAGGIKTLEQVKELIKLGVDYVGTSADILIGPSTEILKEDTKKEE